MQVHVVLRVLGEVLAVAADRHLLERQPGVARLALMPQHDHAARRERAKDGRESLVVDHDGAAIAVAQLHADVFPHLHADGALRDAASSRCNVRSLQPGDRCPCASNVAAKATVSGYARCRATASRNWTSSGGKSA